MHKILCSLQLVTGQSVATPATSCNTAVAGTGASAWCSVQYSLVAGSSPNCQTVQSTPLSEVGISTCGYTQYTSTSIGVNAGHHHSSDTTWLAFTQRLGVKSASLATF